MSITYKRIAKKKIGKTFFVTTRRLRVQRLAAVPRSKWCLTRQFLAVNFKNLKLKSTLTPKNQKSHTYKKK